MFKTSFLFLMTFFYRTGLQDCFISAFVWKNFQIHHVYKEMIQDRLKAAKQAV